MKLRDFILVSSIAVTIAGCSFTTPNNKETNQLTKNEQSDTIYFSYNNCNLDVDTCTYFLAVFPHVKEESSLNKFVQQRKQLMQGLSSESTTSLVQVAEQFIADYDSFRIEFPESQQSWYINSSLQIDSSFNGVTQFKEEYEDYTGGAHGNYSLNFYLVHQTEGTLISIDDILQNDEAKEELSVWLTQTYRQKEQLDSDKNLSDIGLFEEVIAPNNNFYIHKNSISFVYNPYEIGPYSMGIIEVSVVLDEIQHLLNPTFKAYLVEKAKIS